METLIELINRGLSGVLSLDPDALDQIADLKGRCVLIELTAPEKQLHLLLDPEGVRIERDFNGVPDVTVKGSLTDFVKIGVAGGSVSTSGLTISGDMELAQILQRILSQMDLDWEEALARVTGDTAARRFGVVTRKTANWAKETSTYSAENVADYFKDEKRVLASDVAVAQFEQSVTKLRQDVDRLAQRIERIKSRIRVE